MEHSGPLRRSGWLIALLLMAVLLRGLLPQGWMPAAKADGIALVICTSAGVVEMRLDIDKEGQPASHDLGADAACGFAGTNALAAPPVPPALLPVAISWLAISLPTSRIADGPADAPVRLPPSQGPPRAD